jgi:hypothetical protein
MVSNLNGAEDISKVRCNVWLTMAAAVGLGTTLCLTLVALIYASGAS